MKQILLFISFFATTFFYSQKSVKISYEQKIFYSDAFFSQVPSLDSEEFRAELRKPKFFELLHNGDFSLFKSINEKERVITSNEISTETYTNRGTFIKPFNVWILKDFKKNSFIKSTEVEGKAFYVEQPFSVEELKYDKRVKLIDGYSCLSAYSVSAINDTIQYWYTQEIPIIDGPFLLTTIPGLVLSVESKKKVIYVTKIEFFDKKVVIDGINTKTLFITESDLKSKIEESNTPKSYTDEYGKKHQSNTIIIKPVN